MALRALLAELEGHDTNADRGYRAALALRQDEDGTPPDPFEGLARLAAYGRVGVEPDEPPCLHRGHGSATGEAKGTVAVDTSRGSVVSVAVALRSDIGNSQVSTSRGSGPPA